MERTKVSRSRWSMTWMVVVTLLMILRRLALPPSAPAELDSGVASPLVPLLLDATLAMKPKLEVVA